MQRAKGGAYVVLGGSMITAYGVVGLATSEFLNSMTTLGTGDYLRLWAMTFLVIVFGFATILGGYMLASNGRWRQLGGAALGVIGSFGGMLFALALITTVAGINSGISYFAQSQSQSAQFSITYEIQIIGSMAVAVAGFPLAMFGTMAGITSRQPESTENLGPGESPEPSA